MFSELFAKKVSILYVVLCYSSFVSINKCKRPFYALMLPVLFDLFGTSKVMPLVFNRYRPTQLCYKKFTHIFWDDFDQIVYLFTYLHPEKTF
jgi:hypothetical protein